VELGIGWDPYIYVKQVVHVHLQLLMHELARTVCTDQCRLPTFESRRASSYRMPEWRTRRPKKRREESGRRMQLDSPSPAACVETCKQASPLCLLLWHTSRFEVRNTKNKLEKLEEMETVFQ